MTPHPCPAVSRSTLLAYTFGCFSQDQEQDMTPARVAEVGAHVRGCGRCRRLVRRLRSSREALRTLALPTLFAQLGDPPGQTSRAAANNASAARTDSALDPALDRALDRADESGRERLGLLRGRILGAAHDRAWSELGRRLRALLESGRRIHRDPNGAPGQPGDRMQHDDRGQHEDYRSAHAGWNRQRAAVSALARRLEGLGIHVDLSDLPARRPSAPALPWVLRHLTDLLELVGHGDGDENLHDHEGYQPSAAPSFLDSLPPR